MKASQIVIRVGLHELNQTNIDEKTYRVFNTYFPPTFKPSDATKDDIGLIRLYNPIQFIDKQVEPACLNLEEHKNYGDNDLIVSGWGNVMNDIEIFKTYLKY